jgi:hypothetical protein
LNDMTLEEQVNEVITNELSVVDTTLTKSKHSLDVTALISEILSFAVNDTTWAADNDIWSHKETKDRLTLDYPFLTEGSKNKIADIAAYFWK